MTQQWRTEELLTCIKEQRSRIAALEAQLAEDTEKRVRERVREVLHNREEFFEAVERRLTEGSTEEPPHPGPDLRDATREIARYEPNFVDMGPAGQSYEMSADPSGDWVRYEDTEKLVAEVAQLRAQVRELTDWRPMSTIPQGEQRFDEKTGEPFVLLSDEATGAFRLLDSAGNEYVALYGEYSDWEIWDGAEFVPLALEEGVTFVGWLPRLLLAGSEGGDRG